MHPILALIQKVLQWESMEEDKTPTDGDSIKINRPQADGDQQLSDLPNQSQRPSSLNRRRTMRTNTDPAKRSIRDIKRDNEDNKHNSVKNGQPAFADNRKYASRHYRNTNRGKVFGLIGAVIAFVLLFFIIGNLTHKATLTLEPKSFTLQASEALVFSEMTGYEFKTLTAAKEVTIPSTITEEVSSQAEGIITVYNNTGATQRLITNTRFKAPNGVEYITPVAITIPAGEAGQPGVLANIRVVAKVPGEAGNQVVTDDMSVPGLVGTDIEDKIIAQADTEFAGGFQGERLVADSEELAEFVSNLESEITASFDELVSGQIPESAIYIERLGEIDFGVREIENDTKDAVIVTVTGSAEGLLLAKTALIGELGNDTVVSRSEGEDLIITNLDAVDFTVVQADSDRLELEMDGVINLVYELDVAEIAKSIAGATAQEVNDVLSEEGNGIAEHELLLSPFWKTSRLPADFDKIMVIIKDDAAPTRLAPTSVDEPAATSELITDTDDSASSSAIEVTETEEPSRIQRINLDEESDSQSEAE